MRPSARTLTLSAVSVIAVLILSAILWVIFAGSVDHLQTTFNPKSDNAIKIHDLYKLVWILAGIVMAAVLAITLAFSLIFRERPGGKAASHIHGNPKLEVMWTLIPVIIGVLIVIPSIKVIAETTGDAPDGAIEIVATGHQWWFEFEYPDEGLVTANELHIPVGRTVNIELRSVDVIHSFWVPQLAGKVDMVPGHNNKLWFTPDTPGEYYGQCAEFCGTSHANMRFRVVVDTEADYAKWVMAQTADAQPAVSNLAQAGEGIATTLCAACHAIRGTGAVGIIGPDLTHVGSRKLIASGIIDNDTEGLTEWLTNPPEVKPGSKMPNLNLNSEQIEQIVAYLQGLQ